jgi:Rrf2 family protein
MFSKACKYGIKSVAYIATQSMEGNRVKIGDISKNTESPEAFAAKIMGVLTKKQVINSLKGPLGGFDISEKQMKETTISIIVELFDGDKIYNDCVLGLSKCDSLHPCPMHEQFRAIKDNIKNILNTTTIYDLATKLQSGNTILIRELTT